MLRSLIIKKTTYGLCVLLGVIFIVFSLFNIIPVNSASMNVGQRTDIRTLHAIEKELHLDLPASQRFFLYLNDLSPISIYQVDKSSPLHIGEIKKTMLHIAQYSKWTIVLKFPYLGKSFQAGRKEVGQIICDNILATAILTLSALGIGTIGGVFFGVLAAVYKDRWIDRVIVFCVNIGISQPSYFIGMILIILFAYMLGDLTGLSLYGSLIEVNFMGETYIAWKNLILPAIALGIRPISIIAQLSRSSMLDVLTQDYIRTAKSKGLSHTSVIYKHALRNALNPIITSVSGWFASLIAGAYLVEYVFNYKGLGYVTIKALEVFDFPLVMGSVLFSASIFILVQIISDILYGIVDPSVLDSK